MRYPNSGHHVAGKLWATLLTPLVNVNQGRRTKKPLPATGAGPLLVQLQIATFAASNSTMDHGLTEDVKDSPKSVQTSQHAKPFQTSWSHLWFVMSTNPCQGPSQPSGLGQEHYAASWRGGEGVSPTWIQGGKKRTNWKRHWSRAKGIWDHFDHHCVGFLFFLCARPPALLLLLLVAHNSCTHTHNFVTQNYFTRTIVTYTYTSSTHIALSHGDRSKTLLFEFSLG